MVIAEGASNGQSVLRQKFGPARTNEKCDVAARLEQASAEIAADRARSDNENSHF